MNINIWDLGGQEAVPPGERGPPPRGDLPSQVTVPPAERGHQQRRPALSGGWWMHMVSCVGRTGLPGSTLLSLSTAYKRPDLLNDTSFFYKDIFFGHFSCFIGHAAKGLGRI